MNFTAINEGGVTVRYLTAEDTFTPFAPELDAIAQEKIVRYACKRGHRWEVTRNPMVVSLPSDDDGRIPVTVTGSGITTTHKLCVMCMREFLDGMVCEAVEVLDDGNENDGRPGGT